MLRLILKLALAVVLVIVVVGVGAYMLGYWRGERLTGITINPPAVDANRVRDTAADVAGKARQAGARVAAAAEEAVEDGTLTAKIKSKMALDDYVKARNIDVDTVDGIVTVSGTVHSETERERAVRLARETAGVKKVNDALTVGPSR